MQYANYKTSELLVIKGDILPYCFPLPEMIDTESGSLNQFSCEERHKHVHTQTTLDQKHNQFNTQDPKMLPRSPKEKSWLQD